MCTVQGCDNGGVIRKGLCPKHYFRMKRHGSIAGGRTPEGEPMAFLMSSLGHAGTDCLIWPYARDRAGYAKIYNDGHMSNAHRLMCRLKNGEPPKGKRVARHICGKGHLGCVNPNHLLWGTHLENSADKAIHGTEVRGEQHFHSKLTEAEVVKIYALRGSGRTAKSVSMDFPVSREQIRDIWNGKRWAWLTNPVDGPVGAC